MMKLKRNAAVGSSSARTLVDEVDDDLNSSNESDEEEMPVDELPVTYEYVHGSISPVFLYKLTKNEESAHSKKSSKVLKHPTEASLSVIKKQNQQSLIHNPSGELFDDDSCSDIAKKNDSFFGKIVGMIREFFNNRRNWSVTEESVIIWFGFMFFAIVVGCILHFLMA
jgi:hypothetical protein